MKSILFMLCALLLSVSAFASENDGGNASVPSDGPPNVSPAPCNCNPNGDLQVCAKGNTCVGKMSPTGPAAATVPGKEGKAVK